MERIPPELKNQIIRLVLFDTHDTNNDYTTHCTHHAHLHRSNRAQYAAVSREWQAHVEPITFKRLYLDPGRLDQARGIVTPSRQTYVHFIHFNSLLPSVRQGIWARRSEAMQFWTNSEVFTGHLAGLLLYLNGWTLPYENVELSLGISGNASYRRGLPVALPMDVYLQLPKIHFITKFRHFQIGVGHGNLTPRSCCKIASLFPNLRSIGWYLRETTSSHYGSRVQLRERFAAALILIPESVRNFGLAYYLRTGDHILDYIQPRAPDLLSISLRQLSKQLKKVVLKMDIGHEFFFVTNSSSKEAQWPLILDVTIIPGARTPQRDELFGRDAQSQLIIPVPRMINRYYLAAGRAAAHMPNLRCLKILWTSPIDMTLSYELRKDTLGARLFVTDT
ncbi:hypothetical protein PG993_012008 [Apiospora rasikravindrae]|uniref:F-box domain-containing protein n=1 Tax=Apiospora rasikravindrae TaxID=990691 RepID=A0ABR1S197_9PEZI